MIVIEFAKILHGSADTVLIHLLGFRLRIKITTSNILILAYGIISPVGLVIHDFIVGNHSP